MYAFWGCRHDNNDDDDNDNRKKKQELIGFGNGHMLSPGSSLSQLQQEHVKCFADNNNNN